MPTKDELKLPLTYNWQRSNIKLSSIRSENRNRVNGRRTVVFSLYSNEQKAIYQCVKTRPRMASKLYMIQNIIPKNDSLPYLFLTLSWAHELLKFFWSDLTWFMPSENSAASDGSLLECSRFYAVQICLAPHMVDWLTFAKFLLSTVCNN